MTMLSFSGSREVFVLGRVDLQGSLLSTALVHDERLTKHSFYERLALHGHEIVDDDDFAHLYARTNGRPSHPPSVMVRALLCATHDKTSDRESARRSRVDLDWRWAMGDDLQLVPRPSRARGGRPAPLRGHLGKGGRGRRAEGQAHRDHRLLAGARGRGGL